MAEQRFRLVADISSDDPQAIEAVLHQMIDAGTVTPIEDGFHVVATLSGSSARDLNRLMLSALRKAHRRTRLRSEWTSEGVTYCFFDYVPLGVRPAELPPHA